MNAPAPAYLEIIDFIAAGATPRAVIDFRPSPDAQRRIEELIATPAFPIKPTTS